MKKIIFYIFIVLSETAISESFITKPDSLVKSRIYLWTLGESFGDMRITPYDSVNDLFQIYNPAYKNRTSIAFLGNTGQASISNNFFDNTQNPFLFLNNFEPYLLNSSNTEYFNTNKHFTNIQYYSNLFNKSKYEQVLDVLHTQNINKNFNAGIKFNVISSIGQYINQQARDYSINAFSSYIIDRYSAHLSLNYNRIKLNENGGIVSDADVIDSLLTPDNVIVNFENAVSTFTNKGIQLVQRFNFGDKDSVEVRDTIKKKDYIYHNSFIYVFGYDYYKKLYTDQDPDFYLNKYYDTISTLDSTGLKILSNYIQIRKDEKNIFHTGGFLQISNEVKNYHSYDSNERQVYDFLYAGLFNSTSKNITWNISDKYFLDGYYKGNNIVAAEVKKNFSDNNDSLKRDNSYLSLKAQAYDQSPDYFENVFYSNHFKWENNFSDIKGFYFQLNYSLPKYYFNIGVNYADIKNYIYFDTSALPAQSGTLLKVITPYIGKTFNIGIWHFVNTVFYQDINNKAIVRLPEFAFYHSTSCGFFLVKKVLFTRIGIDVYYNTSYYGYSYMPATSVMYIQNHDLTGNYPYFNFFINFRLRRTEIFVKAEHINYGLMQRRFFTVDNYPMNPLLFKFGLSWNFYD